VADDAAGKAIKCKKCGARVPVPAGDEEDAAAGAADAGNGDGTTAPKKKSNKGLIIGLVAGLVAFCCLCTGGGIFSGWYFWPSPPRIEIKDGNIKDAQELAKKMQEEMQKAFQDKTKKK
jgi:hypothetical protein